MRTPGILIFGLVLAPCGWILDLTSTVAPSWRTIQYITKQPQDLVLQQGLWDICKTFTTSRNVYCNQQDTEYFANRVVTTGQKLMVTSLVVNLIGLVVVAAGVKCWRNRPPDWTVTGVGGFLIFFSGILTLIPIAWFTHMLQDINAPSTDIRVGYCIVLGYMGGLMEVLGGGAMFAGIRRCFDGLNRGEKRSRNTFGAVIAQRDIGNQNSMSQEPYRGVFSQDNVNSPQRSQGNGLVNTSYTYEADL
ncbi:claudin-23-like [Colossoma macropomum]|uniref:claudin-23-like n=1 Tax=Colossoma macropomum TaxID=42526 RepID=UPI001864BD4D|nr:claudin-23-like [Colossoma macropomum]